MEYTTNVLLQNLNKIVVNIVLLLICCNPSSFTYSQVFNDKNKKTHDTNIDEPFFRENKGQVYNQ